MRVSCVTLDRTYTCALMYLCIFYHVFSWETCCWYFFLRSSYRHTQILNKNMMAWNCGKNAITCSKVPWPYPLARTCAICRIALWSTVSRLISRSWFWCTCKQVRWIWWLSRAFTPEHPVVSDYECNAKQTRRYVISLSLWSRTVNICGTK